MFLCKECVVPFGERSIFIFIITLPYACLVHWVPKVIENTIEPTEKSHEGNGETKSDEDKVLSRKKATHFHLSTRLTVMQGTVRVADNIIIIPNIR